MPVFLLPAWLSWLELPDHDAGGGEGTSGLVLDGRAAVSLLPLSTMGAVAFL